MPHVIPYKIDLYLNEYLDTEENIQSSWGNDLDWLGFFNSRNWPYTDPEEIAFIYNLEDTTFQIYGLSSIQIPGGGVGWCVIYSYAFCEPDASNDPWQLFYAFSKPYYGHPGSGSSYYYRGSSPDKIYGNNSGICEEYYVRINANYLNGWKISRLNPSAAAYQVSTKELFESCRNLQIDLAGHFENVFQGSYKICDLSNKDDSPFIYMTLDYKDDGNHVYGKVRGYIDHDIEYELQESVTQPGFYDSVKVILNLKIAIDYEIGKFENNSKTVLSSGSREELSVVYFTFFDVSSTSFNPSSIASDVDSWSSSILNVYREETLQHYFFQIQYVDKDICRYCARIEFDLPTGAAYSEEYVTNESPTGRLFVEDWIETEPLGGIKFGFGIDGSGISGAIFCPVFIYAVKTYYQEDEDGNFIYPTNAYKQNYGSTTLLHEYDGTDPQSQVNERSIGDLESSFDTRKLHDRQLDYVDPASISDECCPTEIIGSHSASQCIELTDRERIQLEFSGVESYSSDQWGYNELEITVADESEQAGLPRNVTVYYTTPHPSLLPWTGGAYIESMTFNSGGGESRCTNCNDWNTTIILRRVKEYTWNQSSTVDFTSQRVPRWEYQIPTGMICSPTWDSSVDIHNRTGYFDVNGKWVDTAPPVYIETKSISYRYRYLKVTLELMADRTVPAYRLTISFSIEKTGIDDFRTPGLWEAIHNSVACVTFYLKSDSGRPDWTEIRESYRLFNHMDCSRPVSYVDRIWHPGYKTYALGGTDPSKELHAQPYDTMKTICNFHDAYFIITPINSPHLNHTDWDERIDASLPNNEYTNPLGLAEEKFNRPPNT